MRYTGTVTHWTRSPTGRAKPDRRPRIAHGWDDCDGQIRAQTRPSGLCPDPPGPAMPVTDTAIPASECVKAPSAISRATSLDTAPWASGVRAEPPGICIPASLEQVTKPHGTTAENPEGSVGSAATSPPVLLSAASLSRARREGRLRRPSAHVGCLQGSEQ